MPLHTLDLDPLQLAYHAGRLRLSVISRAEFKFPPGVQLHQFDVAEALATGTLWVGHARVCRIDIRISLNDRPLDSGSNIRILEAIGSRIIGTNLWSQLSLSTSLETSQSDDLESTKSDLSILLNQSSPSSTSAEFPRGWILESLDVKPPPSVLSVQFNGLDIKLYLHTAHTDSSNMPQILRLCGDEPESMLLDQLGDTDKSPFMVFDDTLDGLTRPRPWLAEFIGHGNNSSIKQRIPHPEGEAASPFILHNSHETGSSFSSIKRDGCQMKKPNYKSVFSDAIKSKLQAWLQSNLINPYPDNQEKLQLMEETGLDRKQLNRWFCKARGLLSQTIGEQDEDPVLLSDIDESNEHFNEIVPFQQEHIPVSITEYGITNFNIFDRKVSFSNEVDLYPSDVMSSLLDDGIPALTSPISTQTSSTSRSPFSPSKRTVPLQMAGYETQDITLSSSSILTSAALNIIIGGSACKRSLSNISLQKGFPKSPLSTLVPSLFCPDFKPIMAHNSRFLPTISQAISSSWVRNCQGPGLRRKLLELSKLSPPGADFGHLTPSGEHGSAERLRAVVQRRIWSMMQSKLSDAAAVRKFKWEILDPERNDNPGVGDGRPHESQSTTLGFDEFIEEEYGDDDGELLFDGAFDDEGLLSYFDEMEKLEVEKQTDEMLFGSGEYGEEDFDSEIELLLDENNQEAMLL